MSSQVLHAVMSHVDGIGSVLFTGGEPSLAVEVMEDFIDICQWRKISFGGFYVITNGKAHNGLSRFMQICDKLYWMAEEQEVCGVAVSQDQYHKELRDVAWHRYEMKDEYGRPYGEFPPYFNKTGRDHPIDFAFDEGRAHNNPAVPAYKSPHGQEPWGIYDRGDGSIGVRDDNGGMVYVAANGNVVSTCDMSFRRIDKESKGNVLVTPLPEIIRSFCVSEERLIANG